MKLVYIMSPSYSGSTLLTFLMSTHHRIATVGELKGSAMGDIESYKCSCGELILDCQFWQKIEKDLASNNIEFSVRDFDMRLQPQSRFLKKLLNTPVRSNGFEVIRDMATRIWPGGHTYLQRYLTRNFVFMKSAAEIYRSSYFLDGSKDPIRCRYFLNDGRFETRVIRLVRDGRGVCRSIMKNDGLSMEQSVQSWKATAAEVNRMFRAVPSPHRLTVRYEDLCKQTDSTMGDIWQFLEIEERHTGKNIYTKDSHIIGNRMRLSQNAEIRLDEKWRTELTHQDIDMFDRIGGELNRGLGYE